MQSRPILLRSVLRVFARLGLGLLLLAGLCLALAVPSRPAHAASTLTVTNCSNDSQLQADVSQANTDNDGDTITFSCSGDIMLTKTLSITGSMSIDGSGQSVTLDGGNSMQVLYVNSGITFTLNALTIADGTADGGGGLDNAGGTVNISNSTFSNNSASGGAGGGLYNSGGTVNISNSTFSNNSSDPGDGGGLYNSGGTVTISNSTFVNNSGGDSGGLDNGFGTMNITNSTFANNSASGEGGGLGNGGMMTISNSTLADNWAGPGSGGAGGGLYNSGGTLTISNSTFAGNSAPEGGGLYSFRTLTISNSTFASNSASEGGGLFNDFSTVNISGSIVAENTGGDCDNFGGTITDNGYNLSSDSSCGFTGTGSMQNTNPLLSSLASNGGPTQTMALQQGSPAIDVIPVSTTLCPATDQRGDPRPDDPSETACDMGAYESNYPPPALTLSGTSVSATEGASFSGIVASGSYSGSGTLSASITWGDGTSASAGTVTQNGSSFTIVGSHSYTEEGSYTIQVSVSDGQGHSASASSAATVSDAPLTITRCVASALGHRAAKLTASFSDADPAGSVSDYTATVQWGDGSTSTVKVSKNPNGAGFVLTGTHTYKRTGTYSVSVTVKDQGGSTATKTVKVNVK